MFWQIHLLCEVNISKDGRVLNSGKLLTIGNNSCKNRSSVTKLKLDLFYVITNLYTTFQYAISQLRIVRSGLYLVTYLDVGNFCNKSTETTLHEICVQVFLRFSDSSKPSQSPSLIYELTWLAGISKSVKNLLKTSWGCSSDQNCPQIFMTSRQSKTIGKCAWTLVRR